MATLGVFCGALVIPPAGPEVGGGESKRHAPGLSYGNRNIALQEDEEFIAVLQAFLSRKH